MLIGSIRDYVTCTRHTTCIEFIALQQFPLVSDAATNHGIAEIGGVTDYLYFGQASHFDKARRDSVAQVVLVRGQLGVVVVTEGVFADAD